MPAETKLEELKEEYKKKDEMGIPMSVREEYRRRMDQLKGELREKAHKKKLGQLLLEKKLVSDEDLREALTEQTQSREDKLIGEVLLDKGLITRDQLEEAIKEQVSLTEGKGKAKN
ncbi:hypothetical protein KGY79_10710 [Candidatus Bipolaricaulota bacterium]|nr:hypothetical protein [Candidatus Bipolaricaulota bacterium]